MAEVAVALIGAVIPKLISLLEVEATPWLNIRGDLLEVKTELENIKAFLMANDSSDEENSLLDEVWVKHVRDLAFESEDILDELMVHFEMDGSNIKKFLYKFKFASRLKELISSFTVVRASNGRYRSTNFSLKSSAPLECYDPQQDAMFHDDEMVGREKEKEDIIKMLCCSTTKMKVISVFGTGGVGKTNLVKKVYDDEKIKNTFQRQAWITVSRNFDREAFFRNLIVRFQRDTTPEMEEMEEMRSLLKKNHDKNVNNIRGAKLQLIARGIFKSGRYFVVLDDIWTTEAWYDIKNTFPDLPDCKLLITTRNAEIAMTASNGNESYIFNLKPLHEDYWLRLFLKKTPYEYSLPEQLAEVTRSILNKCAGVPLAIVAISRVLVTKKPTVIEWEKINKNIGTELHISTKRVLSLSYSDLPYHLKVCYLYLSIFPEDHLIDKNRLIRLWIAEGFVQRKDNLTCEQVGQIFLDKLVQRNLIQPADFINEGFIEKYHIHDLLREIIIDKAKNQNLATVASKHNGEWPQQPRRLSLHGNLSILKETQSLERLRSLFMFDVPQPLTRLSVPPLFSKNISFRLLTVLDMQGALLNEFPITILKLRNLKYLNLSHTDIRSIPNSVCQLQNLETLDLKYTYVNELPSGIVKLQRLRDLLVFENINGKDYVSGFRAPAAIGHLQSLQSLFYLDVGPSSNNVAQQLGMLTQLTRLGVSRFGHDNAHDLYTSINNLPHLETLSLSSMGWYDQDMDLQHIVSPLKSLQCLILNGRLASFPSGMAALQNLEKLFLRACKLQTNPLEPLGSLPNLVQLQLIDASTTHKLVFRIGMFEKLRILDLHEFENLAIVSFKKGSVPSLEKFRMMSCKKMEKVPKGIQYPSKLTVVKFLYMPSKLLSEVKYLFEKGVQIKEANWVYKEKNTLKMVKMTATGCTTFVDPIHIVPETEHPFKKMQLLKGTKYIGTNVEFVAESGMAEVVEPSKEGNGQ